MAGEHILKLLVEEYTRVTLGDNWLRDKGDRCGFERSL